MARFSTIVLFAALVCALFCVAFAPRPAPPSPPPPPPAGTPAPGTCSSSVESGLLTSATQTYVIFAASGYTFAGGVASTKLTGNIASYPLATPLSGNTMVTLTGTENLNATQTLIYANQVLTSYNNAHNKPNRIPISGDIGGLTLVPGVYFSATSIGLTGTVYFDAKGNSNAVFLFITTSDFYTSSGAKIVLLGGAQFCHVYWVMGSAATIGVGNSIGGSFNAYSLISVASGSNVTGRLHARSAVTIDSSAIILPALCASSADLVPCTSTILALEDSGSAVATSVASLVALFIVALGFSS